MNWQIVALMIVGLTGCASSGPVSMGENLYTISKTSAACGFRDAGGVKADLSKEMTSFCKKQNLHPEVVSIEALDGVIGRRCASATLEFRCVRSGGNAVYKSTRSEPNRDMNRHPTIATNQGQFGRDSRSPTRIEKKVEVGPIPSRYDQLKELKSLLDTGVITKLEFDREKEFVLSN